jgi:anti-sigma regulatory factor (Ser/Thr protein kinase)
LELRTLGKQTSMGTRNQDVRGSHSFEISLPPSRWIGGVARRALQDLDLPQYALEDAQLILSELLSNSVRHARLSRFDQIRVAAVISDGTLRVDVIDGSNVRDTLAGAIRPAPGAESGWGLFLVDRLASRWGSMPGRHWFQLDLPAEETVR